MQSSRGRQNRRGRYSNEFVFCQKKWGVWYRDEMVGRWWSCGLRFCFISLSNTIFNCFTNIHFLKILQVSKIVVATIHTQTDSAWILSHRGSVRARCINHCAIKAFCTSGTITGSSYCSASAKYFNSTMVNAPRSHNSGKKTLPNILNCEISFVKIDEV